MKTYLVSGSVFVLALGLLTSGLAQPKKKKPPYRNKEAALKLFVKELVPITPGKGKFPATFTMGSSGKGPASEQPAVRVTLKAPFAMARYEVTQELYKAIMGKNPSKWTGPRNSVEMVNWDEARTFCAKLTGELRKRKLLAANEVIRLPSEAEWEYACRAGTTTEYSFGDKVALLPQYAWFKGNSKGEDPPVGRKKPNPWGLYDMHGYIWEWCEDAWHPSLRGISTTGKPRTSKDTKERVLRGGSWADQANACRCATRVHKPRDYRSDTIGFRCVRSQSPTPERGPRQAR